jgi:DNA polymerase III delta prime subunit
MDELGLALAGLVDQRMTAAAHGKPWVALYEAKETARRGHAYKVNPKDPRVLLRVLRFERPVFTEVDTTQRAWVDELIQASNRAAHTPSISDRDADRALDTMALLAESLGLDDALESITSVRAAASTPAPQPEAASPLGAAPVELRSAEPADGAGKAQGSHLTLDGEPPGLRLLAARLGDLDVVVDVREAINYALVHNGISPLAKAVLHNRGTEPVRDLRLTFSIESPLPDSPLAAPLVVEVGDIAPGAQVEIPTSRLAWRLTSGPFVMFDEAVTTSVHLIAETASLTFSDSTTVRLLTIDEWWALGLHETLAAFVRPNDPAVQKILDAASGLLAERVGTPALDGYQTGPERVHQIAEALYDALVAAEIRYVEAPPSFEGTGQRIRSHGQVLDDRYGTCLDLSVLYAAVLEAAGLHPVIVVTQGHAFAGYLTEDAQLPDVGVTQPGAISTVMDSDLFEAVETTAVCAGDEPAGFDAARGHARRWRTTHLHEIDYLLDVHAAHRIVKPLPNLRLEGGERVIEVVKEAPTVPGRRAPSGGIDDRRTPTSVPPRVDRWQRSLLDMTYRNPLLKLKKASSVPVHVPTDTLAQLEDVVAQGNRLTLVPHDDLADLLRAQGARTAADVDADALRRILIEESRLFTATSKLEYHRKLRTLARKAKTTLEETGTDSLYLTIGTLEWSESGKDGIAPLFLVPVKLVGGRGSTTFTLALDETRQVEPNYCLVEKLRLSWGVAVPELTDPGQDESGIDVEGALAAVRSALLRKGLVDFHVEETAHLTLVQFSTLDMWRDLVDGWPSFLERPAVRHMVETPGQPFLDDVAPPQPDPAAEAETYLPIPADGSQIEAIRWAAAGKSFILEGPPGTGKSQTITNLIAHLLAEGKKVLFVAEKQAALDVVKRRLDQVGLGTFSLDVHGKTQTVQAVRQQVRTAMEARTESSSSWETARAQYRNLVDSLSNYPRLLHEPGPVDVSAWEARQVILELHATAGGVEPAIVPRAVAQGVTPVVDVYDAARDLGGALGRLGAAPARSPWRLAGPVDPARLDRPGLAAALERLATADGAAVGPVRDLTDRAQTPDEFQAVARWVESLRAGVGRSASEAREIVTPHWHTKAQEVRAAIETFRTTCGPRLLPFAPQAVTLDLGSLTQRAAEADSKLLGKKKRRRAIIADLAAVLPGGETSVPLKQLTAALQHVVWARDELNRLTDFVRSLPGVELPYQWNPLDPAHMHVADHAMTALNDAHVLWATLGSGRPDHEATQGVIDATYSTIRETLSTDQITPGAVVHELGAAWGSYLTALGTTLDDLGYWCGGRNRGTAMAESLSDWQSDASGNSFVRLQRWLSVRSAVERLTGLGLADVAGRVRDGSLSSTGAENAVRLGVARAILTERLETTGLEAFDDAERARLIELFVTTGEDVRGRLLTELPARIAAARTIDVSQPRGKVADLGAQLARRRGGLSIRQLLDQFGPIITQVTPCFLMSPTSVARFLPPTAVDFDVVVFDEASQIRVPEAVGAMGRGRSVVIVGDSQQMPPSSTFASSAGDDEETDDAEARLVPRDLESILTEGVESRLPRLLLSWHYRSRDEMLIAFSNKTYYEGRLSSFPTPPGRSGGPAIDLRKVAGLWEGGGRGAARVNRAEANAIVDEIADLLAEDADRTIGVVTFNTQQRDLILDLLEALRVTSPVIESALSRADEPLFVKNLENVQGDERDVILFTLAFAKDARGRVPLNWGPLSRTGGEKRLNVAVTRAKERVTIFASFDPHELDLSTSGSKGLADLKDYLLLAQHGAERAGLHRPTARDWHLAEIEQALREAGLEVRTGIGLSDFTVDLAVRAEEDRPWVAVLLDGPVWAQRTSVGDRDGLPRSVLTDQMGWSRVERVWLPTWLREPSTVVGQVLEAAKTAEVPRPRVDPRAVGASVVAATTAVAQTIDDVLSSATQAVDRAAGRVLLQAHPATSPTDPVLGGEIRRPEGVSSFEPADATPRLSREVLDGTGARSRDLIREQIRDVVSAEGPVVVDRLLKTVASRFGLSKLHSTRKEDLRRVIPRGMVVVAANGDLVAWPENTRPDEFVGYRVPEPGGQRELSEVPYQELRNALMHVLRSAHGIGEEDALRETAREFGVTRVAAKVRERLLGVIASAVKEGRVTRSDGYLQAH